MTTQPAQPTVFDIVMSEALPGFASRIPNKAAATAAADRFSAAISAGFNRAKPADQSAWRACGPDSLRAATVALIDLGLNPDPGAREVYIYPRGGQLIVSPTPLGVQRIFESAGYRCDTYLCGAHDEEGLDVANGRVLRWERCRQPLDWVASPSTCIGGHVRLSHLSSGETVHDLHRWMPISEIVKRAKVNGAKGPWEGWWDRMAEKTLLHYMLRLSGIQLSASASTVLDAEWIEVEPAAAAPAARAFAVPAVAPMRQIEAAPTPATPADPVKALRAQRATLIAEIADLSGISGDAVARARAVMRAAGCAEVANPDEAALTTQIDLLTAHLAEAKVAALERDGSPDAR
jgi:hypothetical protein